MAQSKKIEGTVEVSLDYGEFTDKQLQFLRAKTFYVCFGGARGGGKSHIVRVKAVGMCLKHPGIRILMVRCHYPELQENLINPIRRWVPKELFSYNGQDHLLTFVNGSQIKFGHYDGDDAENEYQGTEYDIVFIDEATQLTERAFNILSGICRGSNFPIHRVYLTCNPGGVGHNWVKRLFIDKKYRHDPKNPERNENPEDYTFIFATVEDNKYLLESSPMYLKQLAALPEDIREAHRYGKWDLIGGNYFKEFSPKRHCVKRFPIPPSWARYRSFDYGLDMFACFWWAVDSDGRCWCYREYEHKDLIVQEAAAACLEATPKNEEIIATFAPPDMWSRQKETGKTMAETFVLNGLPILRSDNNRVQGHMQIKEMLAPIPLKDPELIKMFPEGKAPKMMPAMMFIDDLYSVIDDIQSIQADEKNPNDCAKTPHDITHTVDGIRYFAISRVLAAERQKPKDDGYWDDEVEEHDYQTYMCGGDISEAYVGFAG